MANANFNVNLNIWTSGSVIYANVTYAHKQGLSFTYSDASLPTPTMTIAGTTFYDTDFANRVHAGVNVGTVTTTTFSKSVTADGSYPVAWSCGSGIRSDFASTLSGTAVVSGTATPPTGLNVTDITTNIDTDNVVSITGTVSISGWGTGGSTSQRYRELEVYSYSDSGLVTPRTTKAATGSTTSSAIRIESTDSGDLKILPNAQYVIGAFATNGSASAGPTRFGTVITGIPMPTVELEEISYTTAKLKATIPKHGGYRGLTLKLYYGSVTYGTFNLSAGTHHVMLTNLGSNTMYAMQYALVYGSETSHVGTLPTFKTLSMTVGKLYTSVNGKADETDKLYASDGGKTKELKKLYTSVDGAAQLIYGRKVY